MIEYNGFKVFEINYGESDYIVAKNAQDALNYFFGNVGDEFDNDGIDIAPLEKDFIVDMSEADEPDGYISDILKIAINNGIDTPYLIASSEY